jgi:DNA polymerase-1
MLYYDLETTNYDFGDPRKPHNYVVCVAWAEDDATVEGYYGDIMEADEFWQAYERQKVVCAQNAKFEAAWMRRLTGCHHHNKVWHDPMLAFHVLRGNKKNPINLDQLAMDHGFATKDPLIDTLMKNGVCPSLMPEFRLMRRCRLDVSVMRSLHKRAQQELEKAGAHHIYRTRCDLLPVLVDMEAEGMYLDPERVGREYHEAIVELAGLAVQLDRITGGINLKSPDQKAHFLYGKLKFPERKGPRGRPMRNKPSKQFPDGRPKTDAATIQWLAAVATTEKQKEFIEAYQQFAQHDADVSKNLAFFYGVCEERGGHFKASFSQITAATHRLTSKGNPQKFSMFENPKSVQLQNLPRKFKPLFRPPEGYAIVEVDAAQLEFRVAALVSQDEQAMKDILDPEFDAHRRTAAILFDVPDAEVTPVQRQAAKAHTFKPLYGGEKGTPEEERYYKSFRERYPTLANTQESWLADVLVSGELKTPWGMTFFWDTYTKPNGIAYDKRTHRPVRPQVCNYPVQSLATAEMVPIAITKLHKRVADKKLDVRFANTIHDSVICYVREDHLRDFSMQAREAFTTDVYEHLRMFYGIESNVPLGIELKAGDHWAEGESFEWDDAAEWRANNG